VPGASQSHAHALLGRRHSVMLEYGGQRQLNGAARLCLPSGRWSGRGDWHGSLTQQRCALPTVKPTFAGTLSCRRCPQLMAAYTGRTT
jgi:hypothetical protein